MESIEINFMVSDGCIHSCESSFVPRKGELLELHGKTFQINNVKWIIYGTTKTYVEVYITPD